MSTTLSVRKKINQIKAVLFDLDGTLIDSAPGIFNTVEFISHTYRLNMLSQDLLKPYLGEGIAALILQSNPQLPKHIAHQYAKEGFEHYRVNAPSNTKLFPEVANVLGLLNKHQIPWGIVTNKLRNLTLAILDELFILNTNQVLICKDDLRACKPDPYPLIKATEALNADRNNCLYIGDSLQDMQAAKRANLIGIIAMYGYLPKDQDSLSAWPHHGRINNFKGVLNWITL